MGFTHKDALQRDISSMRTTIHILQKEITSKSCEYLKTYHGIKVDMEGLKKIEAQQIQHGLKMIEGYKDQDITYMNESDLLGRVFVALAFDQLIDKKPLSKQPLFNEVL